MKLAFERRARGHCALALRMTQGESMWYDPSWDEDPPPPEPASLDYEWVAACRRAHDAGVTPWAGYCSWLGGRNRPQPAPLDLGASRRAEEPFAAAVDATEASASALAACDPAATSTEQAVVKAGPNAQKPKSAHGIVKSRPTKKQRDRSERNRLAALDRLAVTHGL